MSLPRAPIGSFDVADDVEAEQFGPNAWLVEEMYERFRSDPSSVSPNWQEFFADYRSPVTNGGPAPAAPAAPAATAPAAPTATAAAPAATEVGDPIRGAGAAIVANMERSLGVPTATSFRDVPAKLLEVNRKIINGFLGRSGAGKISFTHLIAYAVVRTIADDMPVMSATFAEDADGKPRVVQHDHVNVGIAVDMEKSELHVQSRLSQIRASLPATCRTELSGCRSAASVRCEALS
jgi:2-oxoglutarate dehydrogenase E1 component